MKSGGTWIILAASLFVILFVTPLFMSPEFKVERSVTINAPLEKVFAMVEDLERHPEWHPWDFKDPYPRVVYGETRRGMGATYFWIGNRDNHGTLTFTHVDSHGFDIVGRLELSTLGESRVEFRFLALDSGTQVQKTFRKHTGRNLFKRYLHPVYRAASAAQLEASLARLKLAAEGTPITPRSSKTAP
jgi:hypothetical protein